MRKLRVLIADDEALSRAKMRRLLASDPGVEIVGDAADGEAATELILSHRPDVVFLDIEMPEMTGFEALEASSDCCPIVVFVTAHVEHFSRAFDVQAHDYLLKPFDAERLNQTLARARQRVEEREQSGKHETVLHQLEHLSAFRRDRLMIRDEGHIFFVRTADINRIEADGAHSKVFVDRAQHLVRKPLLELVARLDPTRFVRVHTEVVVNVEFVKRLQHWFGDDYEATLLDGTKITVASAYLDHLLRLSGERLRLRN
jgi:two-component system LytT family response regulator